MGNETPGGVIWRGQVVTADRLIDVGAVVTEGDRIAWVGQADQIPDAMQGYEIAGLARGLTILPGLVDVHCHGGGGTSFPDAETLDDVEAAANEHLKHGTTTLIASLVTAPLDVLVKRAALLVEAVEQGLVAGIHYEGPFLAAERCGAQDPKYLVPATPDAVNRLVSAAKGAAVSMTIAPEACISDEGKAALKALVAGRVLPSWGHTDCSINQAKSAVVQGVQDLKSAGEIVRGGRATVTHLFNGMRPLHHRDPGPIPAFVSAAKDGEVILEMINDGTHLNPTLVAEILNTVGRDNAVFVTDAMAATGMGDGTYTLGSQRVRVENGIARLADGDAIAGGTAHLVDCVRIAATKGETSLVDAVYLASAQGASVLGLKDRGRLEPGLRADMLITDANLFPVKVVRAGEVVS